jgi:phosphonate transport system permease protein
LESTLTTVAFAVAGTTLSVFLGLVFGILCSEIFWQLHLPKHRAGTSARHAGPWLGVRVVLSVPRAIHEVIWGLFFINILGLNPLVAVLAISIPFAAITAKVFAEILDDTPKEALRALQASGATPGKVLLYGLLTQAFPDLLSYAFYRFECAIRAAAVLGLIGAGGLGYQILLSLQSLRYEQIWTFLYALILLSGLTDAWSSFLRRRLHLASRIELHDGRRSHDKQLQYRVDAAAKRSLQGILLLIPLSFWYVEADFGKLFTRQTLHLLAGVVHDALPPRLSLPLLRNLLYLSAQTLSMSILAIAFAGAAGLLLSFPAATNFLLPGGIFDRGGSSRAQELKGTLLLIASRGVLLVLRGLSEAIWTLLVLFFLFPGILPGALGLGLYNLGVLGRLMAEVTENVDHRPLRALSAQGASPAQVFLYGVLPITLPRYLAYVVYRWEVCIRATVMVGLVGAGGIGRLLADQLSSFDYRGVTTSLVFLIALTFGADLLGVAIRRALRA